MKTAIFIPVRTRSTRLPKKALLKIKGKTVIEHLISRVKLAKLPNLIVLCTTTNPDDTILIDIAKKNGIKYFKGNEKDILDRYLKAALKYDVDFIVNVDGDDIFCDPEYVDKTIEHFKETDADFIKWNGLPFGISPSGINVDALRRICQLKIESDTETGWTRYFTETNLFKVKHIEIEDQELKHPEIRMTLDYSEDYEFFKKVFERLYEADRIFTLREILVLLKNEPDIVDINKHLKNIYWDNYERQSVEIKLKETKG